MTHILATNRLVLREFVPEDDAFILQLLNTPSWLAFIGDRDLHTREDARHYITDKLMQGYKDSGFGFWAVVLKETNTPIGMCGLVKRPGLDDVDIGFAFMPEYEGKGYGYESAKATLDFALKKLKLPRIVAIVTKDNSRSIALLEKIGLQFERKVVLPDDDEELLLYSN